MDEKKIEQAGLIRLGGRTIIEGDYVDLFIHLGDSKTNEAHQFKRIRSVVYDCDEYVWRGTFEKDKKITFTHADGRLLPDAAVYNQISGPGVTFSGAEACADFAFKGALVCPVEGQDLVYNFVDGLSELTYIGKSARHTIFVRVYDNNSGADNDRWLVISLE
jgi:hypothetical protein